MQITTSLNNYFGNRNIKKIIGVNRQSLNSKNKSENNSNRFFSEDGKNFVKKLWEETKNGVIDYKKSIIISGIALGVVAAGTLGLNAMGIQTGEQTQKQEQKELAKLIRQDIIDSNVNEGNKKRTNRFIEKENDNKREEIHLDIKDIKKDLKSLKTVNAMLTLKTVEDSKKMNCIYNGKTVKEIKKCAENITNEYDALELKMIQSSLSTNVSLKNP